MEVKVEDEVESLHNQDPNLTCGISERVGQASGSKCARDASSTFFFLLYNNIWLQCLLKQKDAFL
jgi:hypothetical protein